MLPRYRQNGNTDEGATMDREREFLDWLEVNRQAAMVRLEGWRTPAVGRGRIARTRLPIPMQSFHPGVTKAFTVEPQIVFRPFRFVPARRYPTLRLSTFNVGNVSQGTAGTGDLPLEQFCDDDRIAEMLGKLERIAVRGPADAETLVSLRNDLKRFTHNFEGCDVCQLGMTIRIEMTNVGPETVQFEGYLEGEALIG
jgi:hypothetical protein